MWLLWLFIIVLSGFMAVLLVGLYQSSSAFQIEAARRATRSTCQAIQSQYAASSRRQTSEREHDRLFVMVREVLADVAGVEGGVWDREHGSVAYAYPTHGGAIPKRDLPTADWPWIVEQLEKSFARGAVLEEIRRGSLDTLVLAGCPLMRQPQQLVAWTMMRVRTSQDYDRLAWGLALLLGFAVISGGWLAAALSHWSRGITRLETSLRDHPVDRLPVLARQGHGDIDRIVDALNASTQRLAAARDEAAALGARLAHAERFAALGRIAAGIAHEIRNPIAAMRLKAENALAHSPERQRDALDVIVGQIDRLNELCESLLSLARPLRLELREVGVADWLSDRVAAFNEQAASANIGLRHSAEVDTATFDPAQLGRALDNLMINALQHSSAGGEVRVSARRAGDVLRISVSDAGTGIPAAVRDSLFEPFASDRTGGTGLGLAIAREIVEAHGGAIRVAPSAAGATLEMDVPWRAS